LMTERHLARNRIIHNRRIQLKISPIQRFSELTVRLFVAVRWALWDRIHNLGLLDVHTTLSQFSWQPLPIMLAGFR